MKKALTLMGALAVSFSLFASMGGTAAEALEQIRARGYAKLYLAQGLPVWAVGLAFDPKTRQLVDADVEKVA